MVDRTKGESKNVLTDASSAHDLGISYGKYKAGVRADYADSDYEVKPTEFVKRADEKAKESKVKAFIK